jgi:hypothetical protein
LARFATAAKVIAFFSLLTAVMTWPQAASIATAAKDHQDVYFNMWRFAWVAHALATSPTRLFDGNIFHHEPRTLQLLSSIYYGVFLATLAGLVAVLLLCGMRGPRVKNALAALAIRAALAIVLAAPYAIPYLATKQQLDAGRERLQRVLSSVLPHVD